MKKSSKIVKAAKAAKAVPVEPVIDALAEQAGGAHLPSLARSLSLDVEALRAEMRDLEAHGYVTRSGRTRSTRWHLA